MASRSGSAFLVHLFPLLKRQDALGGPLQLCCRSSREVASNAEASGQCNARGMADEPVRTEAYRGIDQIAVQQRDIGFGCSTRKDNVALPGRDHWHVSRKQDAQRTPSFGADQGNTYRSVVFIGRLTRECRPDFTMPPASLEHVGGGMASCRATASKAKGWQLGPHSKADSYLLSPILLDYTRAGAIPPTESCKQPHPV